uniref:Uncharacterized protein n=1 Tax=Panagrolaimus sp. ES5 TaxID=591445 RepID=A0AC34FMN7_9BILA
MLAELDQISDIVYFGTLNTRRNVQNPGPTVLNPQHLPRVPVQQPPLDPVINARVFEALQDVFEDAV